MTIGCWIVVIIGVAILITSIIVGIFCFTDDEVGSGNVSVAIGLILAAVCIITPIVYSHTESGKRALKDQQSNFDGGIERTVEVYDVKGELVKTYEGKFDIETNADGKYIIFDDENGKRHQIYYTTGTVCIEEK